MKQQLIVGEKLVRSPVYVSDFCVVKNWACNFGSDDKGISGFNESFSFTFIRKGNLQFTLAGEDYGMHTGHVIVDKPNYEYLLKPSIGECTIIAFSGEFYLQLVEDMALSDCFFFSNKNILSILLKAIPEWEYLVYQVYQRAAVAGKLEVDELVIELLQLIISEIIQQPAGRNEPLSTGKIHLEVIERAKEFIHLNFASDISLKQISSYSFISLFHFCRVFRKLTGYTPHQYLHNIRLKHAEMLLRKTNLPVADIAFFSGFSTPEHFSTAFRQKYQLSPTKYRGS